MSRRAVVTTCISVLALFLAGILLWKWQDVLDFCHGLDYRPSLTEKTIENSLDLTAWGKRVFAATQPAVEAKADFNKHCENNMTETSLLGCYASGKIYVFEITRSDLADANKVTMAHELLHAVWERTGEAERAKLEKLLEKVKAENAEWVETELAGYSDDKKLEEIYARAGTKLKSLPSELEQNYAQVFLDRAKIVAYYENYQAPFAALTAENEKLAEEIYQIKAEIVAEKEAYTKRAETLETAVQEFNECAQRAGCFASTAMFEYQRNYLLQEQSALENTRTALNEKIEENNNRVIKFQENQSALGELSDAMNSNAERSIE